MEVIVTTPDGNKVASTDPVKMPRAEEVGYVPRRVSLTDINGPVGEFLYEALPLIAPQAYNQANWRGKLTGEVTSNQSSFLCCGRAVGLATIERRAMQPNPPIVRIHWVLVDVENGGTKEDGHEILRAMKRWARSMDAEMVLPAPEMTNLPLGKVKDILKAKERVELFVPATDK